MVGPKERVKAVRLRSPGDRQVVGVAPALLGLGHQNEAHVLLQARWTFHLDSMIHSGTIVDVMRSIDQATTDGPDLSTDPTETIIADYRATVVAMKCAMSQRLVRIGISMAQLNILYTLHRSGEMSMSRLADV